MTDSDSDCYEASQDFFVTPKKRRQGSSVKLESDDSNLYPPYRATFVSSTEISANMLAGALSDDIGSQEYVDAICGFHDLDRHKLSQKLREEDMSVKEEEMQSQVPFHWSAGRDYGIDRVEQLSPQSKPPGEDRSYIEKLEAEVSRLDHEVTRLQVHCNLLEVRNGDMSVRLERMGGVLDALSDAHMQSQARLRALQDTHTASKSTVSVSVAAQTDAQPMEDLQGYQQLCEIVGYVFTDIGRAKGLQQVR
ncbi:hypothetical protein EV360DRAFT_90563 [Lentinula raphanica]|nr:hypothetical protein EV360DRAFT_90563 [Lentinula raphanica]